MTLRQLFLGLGLVALTSSAQLPGPAVAGSTDFDKLPEAAQQTLNQKFTDMTVQRVMQDYDDKDYNVTLVNGIKVEFDAQGQLTEVEAPRGQNLSFDLVKALVPSKAYRRLQADGMLRRIEGIEFKKGKVVKVDLRRNSPVDGYVFTWEGELIELDD